jgi:hypothetical protein
MTCAEIRHHLETTTLTPEEKISFIQQNLSSSKLLRSYVDKQHFGAKELNVMMDAVKDVTATIGLKTKDMYNELFEASTDTDEDCAYLKKMLDEYQRGKTTDSRWQRVLKTATSVFQSAVSGVASAASAIYNQASVLASWAFTTGFRLWTWVSSNPQTAYFALLAMRKFKDHLCSEAGRYIADAGIQLDSKKSLIYFIEKTTGRAPPLDSSFAYLFAACQEVVKPGLTSFLGRLSGSAAEGFISGGGKKLGMLLGKGVAGIPFVGPLLEGVITIGMEEVCAETGRQVKIQTEQLAYMTNVKNCFAEIVKLANPFDCLKKMNAAINGELVESQKDELRERLRDASLERRDTIRKKIDAARFEKGESLTSVERRRLEENEVDKAALLKVGETEEEKQLRRKYTDCIRNHKTMKTWRSTFSKAEKQANCLKHFTPSQQIRLQAFKDVKHDVHDEKVRAEQDAMHGYDYDYAL